MGCPAGTKGARDMACRICAENPNRRCRGNFADKYLAGDVLKATCGAPIRVEIINRLTGDSASKQEYADVLLEVLFLFPCHTSACSTWTGVLPSPAMPASCLL